jgi:hypothetical protein
MSRTVNITIKMRDDQEAHDFEIEIRKIFPQGNVIYNWLPNTDNLYGKDKQYMKLYKIKNDAQENLRKYIDKNKL